MDPHSASSSAVGRPLIGIGAAWVAVRSGDRFSGVALLLGERAPLAGREPVGLVMPDRSAILAGRTEVGLLGLEFMLIRCGLDVMRPKLGPASSSERSLEASHASSSSHSGSRREPRRTLDGLVPEAPDEVRNSPLGMLICRWALWGRAGGAAGAAAAVLAVEPLVMVWAWVPWAGPACWGLKVVRMVGFGGDEEASEGLALQAARAGLGWRRRLISVEPWWRSVARNLRSGRLGYLGSMRY